ncbi:putative GTPase LSG1-2 [Paratrimastix pyriformis]|uniref:GTPase LSG1-2 n=1 Tax=Paratrimastix pyriformis TaxID=342808 RepID=A0ABQ8UIU6_9EUKA|nr:putative GTPase LSG1-2 [Paratrimastix pyriformis]
MPHGYALGHTLQKNLKKKKVYKKGGRHSVEMDDDVAMGKKPISIKPIMEENDMDEFFRVAEATRKEFTANRDTVRILNSSEFAHVHVVPIAGDLTPEMMNDKLRIPRRPGWCPTMSPEQIDLSEQRYFIDWRRDLNELEAHTTNKLTPFEKNLDIWRQLWRVIEMSHVVLQIVDARNPMAFRCPDLEDYIHHADVGYLEVEEPPDQQPKSEGEGEGEKPSRHHRQADEDDLGEEDDEDSSKEEEEAPKKRVPMPQRHRETLILINKADMLTVEQRRAWAAYLTAHKIPFVFFSGQDEVDQFAAAAPPPSRRQLVLEAHGEAEGAEDEQEKPDEEKPEKEEGDEEEDEKEADEEVDEAVHIAHEAGTGPERIFTRRDLFAFLLRKYKHLVQPVEGEGPGAEIPENVSLLARTSLIVGMVGYPNVGKSTVINALLQRKVVATGPTPGKTKHLQTHFLRVPRVAAEGEQEEEQEQEEQEEPEEPEEETDENTETIMLVDCPGLVFPSWRMNTEEMLCDGILPIDQMRDHTKSLGVIASRIPLEVLEETYGVRLENRSKPTTVQEAIDMGCAVCRASARVRSFMTARGNPDEARAARLMLKDYLKGKLLYVHMPPVEEAASEPAPKAAPKKAKDRKTPAVTAPAPAAPAPAATTTATDSAAPAPQEGSAPAPAAPSSAPSFMSLLMNSGFSKYEIKKPITPGLGDPNAPAPVTTRPEEPKLEGEEFTADGIPVHAMQRQVSERPRDGVHMDIEERRFQRSRDVGVHIMRGDEAVGKMPGGTAERLKRTAR